MAIVESDMVNLSLLTNGDLTRDKIDTPDRRGGVQRWGEVRMEGLSPQKLPSAADRFGGYREGGIAPDYLLIENDVQSKNPV